MRVIVSRSQRHRGGVGIRRAACGTRVSPVQQAVLLSQKGRDCEEAESPSSGRSSRETPGGASPTDDFSCASKPSTGRPRCNAEHEAGELAARLPSDSPIPWLELGHALEIVHRFDEALSLYDRAAAVAPRDPSGPRTGGLRAAHWGELDLAAPRLEEALRRNPGDAVVWHVLGLVRVHLGDLAGARTAYESGLRADPHVARKSCRALRDSRAKTKERPARGARPV